MPAASYRELITIQKPVDNPTLDDAGHWNPSDSANWEDHASVWANIAARGSREFVQAGIVNAEANQLIKVRHCPAVASVLGSYRVKRRDGSFLALTGPAYDPDNCSTELYLEGKS